MRDRRRLLEEERETGETDAMKLVMVAELVDLGAGCPIDDIWRRLNP